MKAVIKIFIVLSLPCKAFSRGAFLLLIQLRFILIQLATKTYWNKIETSDLEITQYRFTKNAVISDSSKYFFKVEYVSKYIQTEAYNYQRHWKFNEIKNNYYWS
jgi:hypothetical protein